MVEIRIEGRELAVEILGLHKLWAFKSKVRVPLSSVRSVRRAQGATHGVWKGIRAPGTHIPGVIVAGTYYRREGRSFYDVRRDDRAIVIELSGAPYQRLVVEVANPDAAIASISSAIA